MADLTEYKCPACGGAMEFDSKLQKMKCPYCDTVMEVDEYQKLQEEQEKAKMKDPWHKQSTHTWEEQDGMRIYVCQSCGGEILADETTGATTCPFCGNKITMTEQFSKDLKPDYIIPFKLDKKYAKEAYIQYLQGKPFLPKCFKEENHIDEMKGIYVPFWIFDIEVNANMQYGAQQIRRWRSGDKEYTETRYFNIHRSGNISYEHIPTDSSKKMDDTLMESIEPYDFKEAQPFQSAFLAGYLADRYDVEIEETIERAKERVKKGTEVAFRNTVNGYDLVQQRFGFVNVDDAKYWYTLYPVWILNTTWKGEKYTFAMNGQTGKFVGNLPADYQAFIKFVVGLGCILSIIVVAITWFIFR